MALKAFIKDLSEVDQAEQALYKKLDSGDGYIIDVAESNGFNLENIQGLTRTLEKQKAEIEQANTALKEFGGLDASEIKRKLSRYEELKDMNPEQLTKEAKKAAKELARAEFQDEIKKLSDVIESRNASLKQAKIGEVLAEIEKAGGKTNLVRHYIDQVCKVDISDDGTAALKIFRDDGQTPRIKVENGADVPFSVSDLVKDLQSHEDYGIIFPSNAKSGSGEPDYNPAKEGEIRTITTKQAESGQFNEEIAAGKVQVEG